MTAEIDFDLIKKYFYWAVRVKDPDDIKVGDSYILSNGDIDAPELQVVTVVSVAANGVIKTNAGINFSGRYDVPSTKKINGRYAGLYKIEDSHRAALNRQRADLVQRNNNAFLDLQIEIRQLDPHKDADFIASVLSTVENYIRNRENV